MLKDISTFDWYWKMDDKTAIVGGTGIIGFFLSCFGIYKRMNKNEQDVSQLRESVRFEVTCEKITRAFGDRLAGIERMQEEIRSDIKTILKLK